MFLKSTKVEIPLQISLTRKEQNAPFFQVICSKYVIGMTFIAKIIISATTILGSMYSWLLVLSDVLMRNTCIKMGKVTFEDPKFLPQQGETISEKAVVKVKFVAGSSIFDEDVFMYIPKNKPLRVVNRPWSIGGNSGVTSYVLIPCVKDNKLVFGQWYCANMNNSATPIRKEGKGGVADTEDPRQLWEGEGADALREGLNDSMNVVDDETVYDFEIFQENLGGSCYRFASAQKKVDCLGFKDNQISEMYEDRRQCNFYDLEKKNPPADIMKALEEWDK